jgi:AraC family transcriptional regulator of adaptative response/methylated-DNA-[protein]-cysteine methyltransferase
MIRTMDASPAYQEPALDDDLCWAAVAARDASFDGRFYYSVSTTGVYCRPSCPSRQARRENIRFHATLGEAETAGFRPCKRCKPDLASLQEQYARKVARACRLIETEETPPSLEHLAGAVGLSPYHFHRVFKAVAGVTPKAYATAHRNKRVRANLKTSKSVTGAIHESGFNSSGRFYAGSSKALGMTPTDFRVGGKDVEMRFAIGECSLGSILVAATGQGVAAISLGDDPEALLRALQDGFPKAKLIGGDAGFERIVASVVGLVERPAGGLDLPLDIQGTAFQNRVWRALRDIPAGATATYTQIAERIGAPTAIRAVAGACAANKLAVAIPCHRVIRNDGSLSGYRWGVERKRALLAREQAVERPCAPPPAR